MFVIDRKRGGTEEVPEEEIDLAGTTGNIYKIKVTLLPSCTCPDYAKGNQCKHIIYVGILYQTSFARTEIAQVMCNVLKAPPNLRFQLAFLSSVDLCPCYIHRPLLIMLPGAS